MILVQKFYYDAEKYIIAMIHPDYPILFETNSVLNLFSHILAMDDHISNIVKRDSITLDILSRETHIGVVGMTNYAAITIKQFVPIKTTSTLLKFVTEPELRPFGIINDPVGEWLETIVMPILRKQAGLNKKETLANFTKLTQTAENLKITPLELIYNEIRNGVQLFSKMQNSTEEKALQAALKMISQLYQIDISEFVKLDTQEE